MQLWPEGQKRSQILPQPRNCCGNCVSVCCQETSTGIHFLTCCKIHKVKPVHSISLENLNTSISMHRSPTKHFVFHFVSISCLSTWNNSEAFLTGLYMHAEISEIQLQCILKCFHQVGASVTKCAFTISDHEQEHSAPKTTMELVSPISGYTHPCPSSLPFSILR